MSTTEPEWHQHYHMLSIIIWCCFGYMLLLFTIQFFIASPWYNKNHSTTPMDLGKIQILCNYGFYLSQLLCSVQCFLSHVSYQFDHVYCIVSVPICTILYGAGKCFLFGIFLERAKDANDRYMSFRSLPQLLMKGLSYYIAFYFVIQLVMTTIFFRGKLVAERQGAITSCHFDEWVQWVPILGILGDAFNALLFLGLFIYPLYQNAKHSVIQDPQNNLEFVKLMKMNIIIAAVCAMTSVFALGIISDPALLVPLFVEYIWLIANIDMIINATAIFILYPPNRVFFKQVIWDKICCCNRWIYDTQNTAKSGVQMLPQGTPSASQGNKPAQLP